MPDQDNPSAPTCATPAARKPVDRGPSGQPSDARESSFHRDFAVQYWSSKLGTAYQIKALLQAMWGAVNDPWVVEPKVFMAASRLAWVVPSKSVRCRLVSRLVKVGAIKKSRATRSGCQYTLLRPAICDLPAVLRDQLGNMSAKDYRFNPNEQAPEVSDFTPKKTKRLPGLPKIKRATLTENNHKLGLQWPTIARFIEIICKLTKGSVHYRTSAKDGRAFATWMLVHEIKTLRAVKKVCRLVETSEFKPEGYALRYVFEVDTPEKLACMDDVLAKLRPAPVKVEGDE